MIENLYWFDKIKSPVGKMNKENERFYRKLMNYSVREIIHFWKKRKHIVCKMEEIWEIKELINNAFDMEAIRMNFAA